MNEVADFIKYVLYLLGLLTAANTALNTILWWEVRTLRGVRHADRDLIARVSLDNEMLTAKVQENMRDKDKTIEDLKNEKADLRGENSVLKLMLKQAGKDAEVELTYR